MLEAFFPSLASSGYEITSPKSDAYNCIAWAASDVYHCWRPVPAEDTFWPLAAPREATLEAFVAAFATLGYEVCQNPDWEPGFEKVALYARESAPTHAARQCPDGRSVSYDKPEQGHCTTEDPAYIGEVATRSSACIGGFPMGLRKAVVVLALVAMSVTVGRWVSGADRSQAGPQASAVTVPPRPTPTIPEGNAGLAAKYPGDMGIERDPDVVFVESFEDPVDEICRHWESAAGKPIMSKSHEVPPGSGGKQSLLLTRVAGGTDGYMDGGNLYRRLKNEQGAVGYEQLFFRFYMKFNREHAPIHHYGSGLLGFHPPTPWPQGGAGERPRADARWTTQVEPGDFTSWNFYSYWQQMSGSPPRGQTWGNNFESGVPPRTVAKERWICLEVMVKLNDIGDSNGEQAYWLDGRLSRNEDGQITSYLGKGFPSVGTWIYDKFKPYVTGQGVTWDYGQGKGAPIEGGKPFPGFAWRNTPELNINGIWLYRYMSQPEQGTSQVWWDHVVVAKKYIGPLTPASR